MTRPCPGPNPPVRSRMPVPPGACDTHVHVIGPYDKFPIIEDRGYTSPEAPVEKLRDFLDTMGLARCVIAHVTVHGTDLSATLDAIKVLDGRARGIAILDANAPEEEIDRLHAGGIRGIRLTPLFGDEPDFSLIERLARRIERVGWHILFMPSGPQQWLEIAPRLKDLPVDTVLDHMAWRGLDWSGPIDHPEFRALVEAATSGRSWVKLAAPERYSREGHPWADVTRFVRPLVEAAPDRLIWGSDWPHVRAWDHPVPNDNELLDWMLDWETDEATIKRILVDNPARLYGFEG